MKCVFMNCLRGWRVVFNGVNDRALYHKNACRVKSEVKFELIDNGCIQAEPCYMLLQLCIVVMYEGSLDSSHAQRILNIDTHWFS